MVKKRRLSNIIEDHSTEMHDDSSSNISPPMIYSGNDLINASFKGDHDTVKDLLEKEIDANYRDAHNRTSLRVACECGFVEVIKILLAHGANMQLPPCGHDYNTALGLACKYGHITTVEVLLNHGADINQTGGNNMSPLVIAMDNYHFPLIRYLLEHSADANKVCGSNGRTPLMIAASDCKNLVLIELLMRYGADANTVDSDGWSALVYATDYHRPKVVKLLLEYGADIYAEDGVTNTLFHRDLFFNNPEMMELGRQFIDINKRGDGDSKPIVK